MRPSLFLVVLCGIGWTACAEPTPVRVPDTHLLAPDAPEVQAHELAIQTHTLVNEERALRRLRPLRWSELLSRVAEQHSQDMAQRGYFDHVTPEGRVPADRVIRANATCGGQRAPNVFENLAQTWLYRRQTIVHTGLERKVNYDWRTQEQIAEESVTRWIRSPSHRDALLNGTVHQQGIGVAIRGDGQVLITQVMC